MTAFAKNFLSFDKLIGGKLITLLYFIGLALIALSTILAFLGSLIALPGDFFQGLLGLIGAPIIGAIALIYWRFLMELAIIGFRIHDRVAHLDDTLPR